MKNERNTVKEIIVAILICILVTTVTLTTIINRWVPEFVLNNATLLLLYSTIIGVLFLAGVVGIIATVYFGVMVPIYNKREKKCIETVNRNLSTEYSSVKLLNVSDLKYFIKCDDIKCEAKHGKDGTVDLKIQIDVNVTSDAIIFTDSFKML